MDSEMVALSHSLVAELTGSIGFRDSRLLQSVAWPIFRPATDALAKLGLTFDRMLAEEGLPKASEWLLTHFCTNIASRGNEHIPQTGPVLVVSNHPGAYDALVIFSKLGRKDIHLVSSEIPFLKKLPHVQACFHFASRTNIFNRMSVMRSAIRHLQNGGLLVYFGAGHREPDPAVYPGAEKMMDNWLEGIDFFFKHIRDLKLLPTVVSGVVLEKWARHPITLLRREQIDKQRLSEFGQVITQLIRPGKLMLSSSISFGPPATADELHRESGTDHILPAVIARGKALLADHIAWTKRLQVSGIHNSWQPSR
jgi:hypothetical protein